MSKTLKIFSLVILSSLSLFALAFSQAQTTDSIRFVTYYPSPYGSYAELRSKKLAVGAGYINAGTLSWNTGGPCMLNEICNADLVVEGNVGIGTAQPGQKLAIVQTTHTPAVGDLSITSADGEQIQIIDSRVNGGNWRIGASIATMGYFGIVDGNAGTGGTDRLVIDTTGNVGIGTTSPNSPAPGPGGTPTTGNLDVNDVYLRSTGKWASQSGRTPTGPISMTVTKDQNYQISTTKDAFLYITSKINQAMKVYLGAEPVPSVLAITLYSPNSQWGSTVTLYVPKNWYFRVWTNALDPAGACYVTLD